VLSSVTSALDYDSILHHSTISSFWKHRIHESTSIKNKSCNYILHNPQRGGMNKTKINLRILTLIVICAGWARKVALNVRRFFRGYTTTSPDQEVSRASLLCRLLRQCQYFHLGDGKTPFNEWINTHACYYYSEQVASCSILANTLSTRRTLARKKSFLLALQLTNSNSLRSCLMHFLWGACWCTDGDIM
jgi:hypothetical protein